MLETAEKNCRIRAVQMHLHNISVFLALPTTMRCCDPLPVMAASAKRHHLSADEADREWIYDTGAGQCFIGEEYLTDRERRSTFKTAPITFYSATGTEDTDRAVMCNVLYIGRRFCRIMKIARRWSP